MKTLYKKERYSEPVDVPNIRLNLDGVYIVTIVLVTIIFSLMIGVYL